MTQQMGEEPAADAPAEPAEDASAETAAPADEFGGMALQLEPDPAPEDEPGQADEDGTMGTMGLGRIG